MTNLDIPKHRLINQQIAKTKFKKPSEIISWLGAVQAQEYACAKWAIGLRLPCLKDTDIDQAFNNGDILRTHLLRPTWHFVTPSDIRWMLELTAPRVKAINAYTYRQVELNDEIFKLSHNILTKALEGGKYLTRSALKLALEEKGIIAEGLRLTSLMMQAELDGIICSGPRIGKQFTYALLDERVPPTPKFDNDQALAELTKRYFYSRGPATLKDFSTWSGLTLSQVKRGLSIVKSHFICEKIDGQEYYFAPDLINENIYPSVYLLPIYDEYIMGYKNRDAILKIRNEIDIDLKFVFDQTIVIDGQIVGTWKRDINKKSIDLQVNFFQPLNEEYKDLFDQAVNKFSRFMDLPVTIGSVNNIIK